MKTIRIGQFGLGCVGEGLFDIIEGKGSSDIIYEKICICDIKKKRKVSPQLLTDNPEDIFNDPNINLIIELINDVEEAFEIVSRAIKLGIPVISANKKMIALYFESLQALQREYNTPFLYEGAVCGAIPILRTLEEYYRHDQIAEVEGIFNGTTNYILTRQYEEGISFNEALKDAQENGFAEADPTSDIDAHDPKYKLKILIAHAFGLDVAVENIINLGIRNISLEDISYARNRGMKYRLISKIIRSGDDICAFVSPTLVREEDLAYKIDNEDNYVSLCSNFTGKQLLLGKGAGSHPTGMAVFSDLIAIKKGYKYEVGQNDWLKFSNNVSAEVFISARQKQDLEKVILEETYQVYESKDYFYKTGKINFSNLSKMEDLNVFIGFSSNEPIFEASVSQEANCMA